MRYENEPSQAQNNQRSITVKKFILAALVASAPLVANAVDINVNLGGTRIQTPGGTTITFGTRDPRGYYWDGYEYRNPDYWRRHNGHRGERYYTGYDRGHHKGHDDHHHCPPGQAKKGHC